MLGIFLWVESSIELVIKQSRKMGKSSKLVELQLNAGLILCRVRIDKLLIAFSCHNFLSAKDQGLELLAQNLGDLSRLSECFFKVSLGGWWLIFCLNPSDYSTLFCPLKVEFLERLLSKLMPCFPVSIPILSLILTAVMQPHTARVKKTASVLHLVN